MKVLSFIFRVLALLLLISIWIYSLYCYTIFPESIPVHFNFNGTPDRFGNKLTIILLPIISTFVFFVLSFALNFSMKESSYTKDKKINENFKPIHLLYFNYLKFIIQLIFLEIIISTHLIVLQKTNSLLPGFNITLLTFIFIPTFYYAYKAIKSNN
ncbi:MAG: DUF1648 domain-containing protein [Chitinophagaceae bacterium]|nr:DUF1648 domain-containing protein [Chitinophagaceae bacterium]